MHLTHLVIDDFFDRPDEIRQQALATTFPPRPDQAYYPGRNAGQQIPLPGIERLVSDLVHEPVKPIPFPNTSHCYPRLALAGDERGASVHADFAHWSGIIFLTPDRHCQGGTHFFRHKRTGWEMAPVWPGMAEQAGYENADTALQSILKEDGADRSKWEETMTLPMKYNRLILFRGYLWHDAGISFGSMPDEGRLILPLFFENMNPG